MANEEHLKILYQGVDVWNQWRQNEPFIEPDLSGPALSGLQLKGIDFSNANLNNANLRYAIMIEADFSWSYLSTADLTGAKLCNANLREANLNMAIAKESDFKEANLCKAKLEAVDFSNSYLTKAKFTDAVLVNANLTKANIEKSELLRANLIKANLTETMLDGAMFQSALLIDANLCRANLVGTHLAGANLEGANLRESILECADLRGSNLRCADLSGAYVSKAIINSKTLIGGIKGCEHGVNGIWCRETDSAALMTLFPPGNSMQGTNSDAIIESLKHARRLHGGSLSLVGIVLLMVILGLKTVPIKDMNEYLTPANFGLLAMLMSIGFIALTNAFMKDALSCAQYIQDRNSAQIVGNFPWILSRYAGGDWGNRLQSLLIRIIIAFHPTVYIYYYWLRKGDIPIVFFLVCSLLLVFMSIWTFRISQKFQKPILFDTMTEKDRKNDFTILAKAIEKQTESINELVEISRHNVYYEK